MALGADFAAGGLELEPLVTDEDRLYGLAICRRARC